MKILDLGCSDNKVPGAIGVDIRTDKKADVIHDLNVFPYPFETDSIDKVYAKHIIEHLSNPGSFIKEIYRILKRGGEALIETPHFSNYVAYSDPGHKIHYSYFTFRNLLRDCKFSLVKQEITFYKSFRFFGIMFLANKYPEQYERFWTYIFPAENLVVKLKK